MQDGMEKIVKRNNNGTIEDLIEEVKQILILEKLI